MSVSLNSKGSGNAKSLARSGKVTKSGSWSSPSAEQENAYIKKNGMGSFGRWYMGVDSSVKPEEKGHYKYPFSSDFKTVNRAGIVAIRQRAGQQGAQDIFNAAGAILNIIDKKKENASVDLYMDASFQNGKLHLTLKKQE